MAGVIESAETVVVVTVDGTDATPCATTDAKFIFAGVRAEPPPHFWFQTFGVANGLYSDVGCGCCCFEALLAVTVVVAVEKLTWE